MFHADCTVIGGRQFPVLTNKDRRTLEEKRIGMGALLESSRQAEASSLEGYLQTSRSGFPGKAEAVHRKLK